MISTGRRAASANAAAVLPDAVGPSRQGTGVGVLEVPEVLEVMGKTARAE
ncbi:hypothetical protein [Paraburkholderia domus]|nr:hypothetical protein [Paraburkholderia domus]